MARRGGAAGLFEPETYDAFRERVERRATSSSAFSGAEVRTDGGSSATVRRRAGTRCSTTTASGPDTLDYIVDRNPLKHGLYSPGMHIPVRGAGAARRGRCRLHARDRVELRRRDHAPAVGLPDAAGGSSCRSPSVVVSDGVVAELTPDPHVPRGRGGSLAALRRPGALREHSRHRAWGARVLRSRARDGRWRPTPPRGRDHLRRRLHERRRRALRAGRSGLTAPSSASPAPGRWNDRERHRGGAREPGARLTRKGSRSGRAAPPLVATTGRSRREIVNHARRSRSSGRRSLVRLPVRGNSRLDGLDRTTPPVRRASPRSARRPAGYRASSALRAASPVAGLDGSLAVPAGAGSARRGGPRLPDGSVA